MVTKDADDVREQVLASILCSAKTLAESMKKSISLLGQLHICFSRHFRSLKIKTMLLGSCSLPKMSRLTIKLLYLSTSD